MTEDELLQIDEELADPVLDDNTETYFGAVEEDEHEETNDSDVEMEN
jgi:hypothetical protein